MEKINIGVRWDTEEQNKRFDLAFQKGLIDYIEVNYPIAAFENPCDRKIPIYAHSSFQPLASACGINRHLAEQIKLEIIKTNTPWVGEHLSWLGFEKEVSLGYVFNPIYTKDFLNVCLENIKELQGYYECPIALEMGPHYNLFGEYQSEIDFILEVAEKSKSYIILDISHLMISNHNLNRKIDFGLDKILDAPVIEAHLSGIRQSAGSEFWHDCHSISPNKETLNILEKLILQTPLKAITLEQEISVSEDTFLSDLNNIHDIVNKKEVAHAI
jgi:uncharacterized protein (UPF0276 family)